MVDWPGDLGPNGDSVPLRLAGTLHALVLEGIDETLSSVYPPNHTDISDNALWSAVEGAIERNGIFVSQRLKNAPQTNEVRRSNILLPGFMEITEVTGLSNFVMSEVGASAGLNLIWDKYFYTLAGEKWGDETSRIHLEPDWSGRPPIFHDIKVTGRAGCDLNPLLLDDEPQRRRLMSYVWPDQEDRISRTKSAIELYRKSGATVKPTDAIPWLKQRLSERYEGSVHVIYNTIAWQYLPAEKQKEGHTLIQSAGEKATPEAPLAWLSFEADGNEPGAVLKLTIWPSGEKRELARADFHGRWVKWL